MVKNSIRDWFRRLRRSVNAATAGISGALTKAVEEYRIRHELAICLKFKNAGRYLKEWIEFHRLVGVEHFYLYNHKSEDHFQEILAPYIAQGLVTLNHCHGDLVFPEADEHCFKHYAHQARWIAFLDDDEFLFPVTGDDLRKILPKYSRYPGLAVHWRVFGASGHDQRPEGLVIESYTRCRAGIDPVIKSIVNPRKVLRPKSVHYPLYKDGEYAVDEKRLTVKISNSKPATADKIRINHYYSKSLQDFREKLARGYGDQWGIDNPRAPTYDTRLDAEEDLVIQRFLPALKKALGR